MPRKRKPLLRVLKQQELADRLGLTFHEIIDREKVREMLDKNSKQSLTKNPFTSPPFYLANCGARTVAFYKLRDIKAWLANGKGREALEREVRNLNGKRRDWPEQKDGQKVTVLDAPKVRPKSSPDFINLTLVSVSESGKPSTEDELHKRRMLGDEPWD